MKKNVIFASFLTVVFLAFNSNIFAEENKEYQYVTKITDIQDVEEYILKIKPLPKEKQIKEIEKAFDFIIEQNQPYLYIEFWSAVLKTQIPIKKIKSLLSRHLVSVADKDPIFLWRIFGRGSVFSDFPHIASRVGDIYPFKKIGGNSIFDKALYTKRIWARHLIEENIESLTDYCNYYVEKHPETRTQYISALKKACKNANLISGTEGYPESMRNSLRIAAKSMNKTIQEQKDILRNETIFTSLSGINSATKELIKKFRKKMEKISFKFLPIFLDKLMQDLKNGVEPNKIRHIYSYVIEPRTKTPHSKLLIKTRMNEKGEIEVVVEGRCDVFQKTKGKTYRLKEGYRFEKTTLLKNIRSNGGVAKLSLPLTFAYSYVDQRKIPMPPNSRFDILLILSDDILFVNNYPSITIDGKDIDVEKYNHVDRHFELSRHREQAGKDK